MAEIADLLFLIGRLLLGGFFLHAGINHVAKGRGMIGYAQMKGVPAPALAVYGSGILALLGGASVVAGLYPFAGLTLLVLFLLGVTPKMHAFWKESDPMARMAEQAHFLKNIALMGAVLALYVVPAPWPWSP